MSLVAFVFISENSSIGLLKPSKLTILVFVREVGLLLIDY